MPGAAQYTKHFTSITDKDVKKILAKQYRGMFFDADSGYKEVAKDLPYEWVEVWQWACALYQKNNPRATDKDQRKVAEFLATESMQVWVAKFHARTAYQWHSVFRHPQPLVCAYATLAGLTAAHLSSYPEVPSHADAATPPCRAWLTCTHTDIRLHHAWLTCTHTDTWPRQRGKTLILLHVPNGHTHTCQAACMVRLHGAAFPGLAELSCSAHACSAHTCSAASHTVHGQQLPARVQLRV